MSKWENTVSYLEKQIKGFEVKDKDDVWHQILIDKLLFFSKYIKMWSALYPKVWKPKKRFNDYGTLQHEGVHLLDAQTFFGLLPPKPVLRWINVALFCAAYGLPQILALLAFGAISGNFWWLLCLLFLLPLPAPGRMWAEVRAYRRTRELGMPIEGMIENFTKEKYYFMWPFPKHIRKLLKKRSPYRNDMDELLIKK